MFNPYSAESIAEAVEEYEKGECGRSELTVRNQIEELISLIAYDGKR